jgi:hypothetical protein
VEGQHLRARDSSNNSNKDAYCLLCVLHSGYMRV